MTNEQINAAIAEACEWKGNLLCRDYEGNLWPSEPPNYCSDLNAMHDAEKVLNREQSDDYIARLFDACAEATVATARQRAEAFLRTLGKWNDQLGDATEMEVQK